MKTNVLSKVKECPIIYNETKSPFAVYENEELIKVKSNLDTAITSTNNELDKLIIFALSRLLVSTSALLEIALHNLGVRDITQKDLQKRLKLLNAAEFVEAYRFENTKNGTRSSNQIYSLGWRGVGLLRANGQKPRLGGYLKELSSPQMKKILSVSQYLIKSGVDIDHYVMCESVFVPAKNGGRATKIFRPQARIIGNIGNETVFVESVRQTDAWRTQLIDKLERIAAVAQARGSNIDFDKNNSALLLIAEDSKHMQETMKLVTSEYLLFPLKIYYSADTLTYANPDNCVFSIKSNFLASLFIA